MSWEELWFGQWIYITTLALGREVWVVTRGLSNELLLEDWPG